MGLTSSIIKNISKDRDKLCEVLLGSIYDEEDVKYSKVYIHELKEFLEYLEHDLDRLENNNINISADILKSYITTNWFCDFDGCDMKEFNKYVNELLELSKRDLTQGNDLNISEEEKKFIRGLLSDEINRNRDVLIHLSLKKEDGTTKVLLHFKETDTEHYNHLIKSIKEDYVQSVNLLYKIFNEQPKDWTTSLNLHNAVCRDFNINREEFLF